MVVLTQYRQYLEQAREELKRECALLQAQLDDRKIRLDALSILLTDEKPASLFPDEAVENPENDTITSKAREILREANGAGLRPRDIKRLLRQQGVAVKDTFASNFLWRMRYKTKEAVTIGGRYYWKGNEPNIKL